MINLLQIEWRKLKNYRMFWGLVILYFLFLVLLQFVLEKFEVGKNGLSIKLSNFPIYQFPDVWHMITYAATFLKFIPAALIVILITNEFEFRTSRQNLIDGISRNEFLLSKLMLVVIIAIVSIILIFLSGLYLGIKHTESVTASLVFQHTKYIAAYFLELLTFLLFAAMLSFMLKRAGFALGLMMLYYWIVETIAVQICKTYLNEKKYEWVQNVFPLNASRNLVREPISKFIGLGKETTVDASDVYIALLFCMLFCIVVWKIFKRDL